MNKRQRRRSTLFQQQQGRCFFCDQPTKLLDGGKGRLPHDAATLYHLDSRYDADRGQHPDMERTVLTCWACSAEISADRQALVPIEELHRRSGRPDAKAQAA